MQDALLKRLTDALILCFFACKAQSLFAIDCFVHTVVALYQQQCTISELQVLLAMKPFESGATILSTTEQDILLSWAVFVMLALYEMEIPHKPELDLEDIIGRKALSMKPFVTQVIALFRSGTDIDAMLDIQEQAKEEEVVTESLRMMHLNSLTVALTVSVAQKLRQSIEDTSDGALFRDAYTGKSPRRGTALTALIASMGATVGPVFCIDHFIEIVTEGYEEGLTARELVESITDEEYEQACQLLPIQDAATAGIAASIGKQLFGRWVSIVFMTLAQSGATHRLASEETGWAWAFEIKEDTEMFEMTNLSNFVSNSLRKVISEDTHSSPDLSDRLKNIPDVLEQLPKYKEEAEKKKAAAVGSSWVTVVDEEMQRTSPSVLAFWQMIFLVHLTYTKLMAAREQQQFNRSSSS